MANADAAFGLRPIRYVSGAPYNGAANVYAISGTSGDGAVYIGDPVSLVGTADANGIQKVSLTSITAAPTATTDTQEPIVGVVVGVASSRQGDQLQDDDKYVASGTGGAGKYVLVADDPNLLFEVQEDGNLGIAGVGAHFQLAITAGNNTSGISKTEIDSSDVSTSDASNESNVKVLRLRQKPDNSVGTNAVWEVMIVNHAYRSGVNTAI